jgi:ferredoxin
MELRHYHPPVPKIEFLASVAGSAKETEAPEGGVLLEICDDALAPIPFSCRSASCATCHIEVLEGKELLEPPQDAEQDLLDVVGGPAGSRLACQAIVKPGPGLIRIRSLDAG